MRCAGRSCNGQAIELAGKTDGEIANINHLLHFAAPLEAILPASIITRRPTSSLAARNSSPKSSDEFAAARRWNQTPYLKCVHGVIDNIANRCRVSACTLAMFRRSSVNARPGCLPDTHGDQREAAAGSKRFPERDLMIEPKDYPGHHISSMSKGLQRWLTFSYANQHSQIVKAQTGAIVCAPGCRSGCSACRHRECAAPLDKAPHHGHIASWHWSDVRLDRYRRWLVDRRSRSARCAGREPARLRPLRTTSLGQAHRKGRRGDRIGHLLHCMSSLMRTFRSQCAKL